MLDEPLAFFITWTVYGTFLQGDPRGWRRWRTGEQPPRPRLAQWRAERLKHSILLLDAPRREAVTHEIHRLSAWRGWTVWAHAVRSNHVHVVVHARGGDGSQVRDQLKANCTRALRAQWNEFQNRPAWTVGGDWQCIDDVTDLEQVILYVTVAQDRKGREASPDG